MALFADVRSSSRSRGAAVALAGMLGMCAIGCSTLSAERQIQRSLDNQAAAWNRGDIEQFMHGYWRSEQLTFASGGDVTRGFEPTLTRYRARYTTREQMGTLTFSELEVRRLGRRHAMVLGRWRLDRDEPVEGLFTLVLRRHGREWRIIHDHTSTGDHGRGE